MLRYQIDTLLHILISVRKPKQVEFNVQVISLILCLKAVGKSVSTQEQAREVTGRYIVAKSCGIVIGYANFSYSNTQHYFIESIGVANNYRNLGIGQALLQTIVDEVLPPQMRVTVDVPEYFSDSVAFFKRAGFEPADRRARTSTRNATRLVLDLSSR